ncbi:unnamed protein product, partial [Brugia timori]
MTVVIVAHNNRTHINSEWTVMKTCSGTHSSNFM